MNVIHIASNSKSYEIVELLANKVNKKNNLSVIKINGEIKMTGGFILNNDPLIRGILDNIPEEYQYNFIKTFRQTPFKKQYYEQT